MKILLLFTLLISNIILGQSFVPNAPDLNLKSYIIIDPTTNTVIAESNSDGLIEPASMTKVMTAYVVADQIKNNLINIDDEVLVSEKAWRMGGSKMFIEVGKKVSILDLLKGIIIQSGNDAAVAIAEYVGGTEDGFVDLMNSYAASIGMNNTTFMNSTGLPDANHLTTASDLALLTSNFITKYPDIYALFKEKEFEYGGVTANKMNRNRLLWIDETSDGVKTGHTSSAGWCLIGSAKRPMINGENMRLITVVAGSDSQKNSFADTQRLLEYGFRYYATQKYFDVGKEYANAKVWGGKSNEIGLGVESDIYITLPRTKFDGVKVNYVVKNNVQAPISKGDIIGSLELTSDNSTILISDLVALEDVEAKGFFGRLWSRFVLWVMGLFGMT